MLQCENIAVSQMTHKLFICTLVTITPYSHQSAAFIAHVQEHITCMAFCSFKTFGVYSYLPDKVINAEKKLTTTIFFFSKW